MRQAKFRRDVFQRYGAECAVCGLDTAEMLNAAHVCDKQSMGSDDPRNGLVLCANHHAAFDPFLFAIEPKSLEIKTRTDGPDCDALAIDRKSLKHLREKPALEALDWAWRRWNDS